MVGVVARLTGSVRHGTGTHAQVGQATRLLGTGRIGDRHHRHPLDGVHVKHSKLQAGQLSHLHRMVRGDALCGVPRDGLKQ